MDIQIYFSKNVSTILNSLSQIWSIDWALIVQFLHFRRYKYCLSFNWILNVVQYRKKKKMWLRCILNELPLPFYLFTIPLIISTYIKCSCKNIFLW